MDQLETNGNGKHTAPSLLGKTSASFLEDDEGKLFKKSAL